MDVPQSNQSQNVFQVTEEIGENAQNLTAPFQGEVPSGDLTPSFTPPEDSALGETPPAESGGIGKIIIPLIVVILLAVVGVFVFNLFKGKGEGQVNLTYWGLWEDEAVMQPLIDDYQKLHPNIKITYILQTSKQYRERLEAALGRGEVDIFRFHNTWVPMLKQEMAPLPESIFPKKDYESIFYPVVKTDLKVGGDYVGIPLMIDGLSLYYNEDILKAAGLAVPKTWDELQETATKLTVKDINGEIKTAGVALGTAGNIEHFSDILALMFMQNGANLVNPVGPEASEALAFYRLFAEKPNNTWNEAQQNSINAFANGKVAMIFAPSWEAFTILSLNPNLVFKTAPVPQLPGTNITWATYWVEGVSNKSKFQKEAWNFLKYLSDKENMVKLYTQESKIRAFGEPYSRNDLAQTLADHPVLGSYILQGPTSQSFPLASRTYDNGINDRLIKYLEDAVNSLASGNSPDSALQTAAQGFQQVLSQYGITTWPASQ